ncbi:MAG: methylenetetrahydrofolate reductase [NAD(P)H] [Gammaproteobacteria bacterium]|nr:methylenetetrahydrofolate reductase [NAD(P)H] [Gammaproteobacteria bacterium]
MKRTFSCEFFPPKTNEGLEKLLNTSATLKQQMNPEFFSVTFGAGGSTRERTFNAVSEIIRHTEVPTAPHLSCIGSTKDEIAEILLHYKEQGIKRLVALRGDMPSGMVTAGELHHANELVSFIRQQTGDHFHIEVAAYPEFHPQCDSPKKDLEFFKQKVEAGADSAITQYFYNVDAYYQFVDDCELMGLDIPIIPGIMPITNFTNLARFSDACGTEIPRWIRKRLQDFSDDTDSLKAFGKDVVTDMCQRLLDNDAPGLHFYSMNQTEATLAIWNELER